MASFPHQYSLAETNKVMIPHAAEGLSPYSFFMDSDVPEVFANCTVEENMTVF